MSTLTEVSSFASTDLQRTGARAPAPSRVRIAVVLLVLTGLNVYLAYRRGTHIFNFSDSGYLLENLHRIHDGEIPYRDFFLSLPPAHHYACAAVWWLFGDQAYYLVIYAAIQQGLVFLLCFLAGMQLANRPWAAVLAAALVTVGGTAVMSFPLYDTDGGFLFIVIVNLLLWWESRGYGWKLGLVIGFFTGLVVLVKLNMGLPLLAGILLSVLAAQVVRYWYGLQNRPGDFAGRLRRISKMPLPFATVGSVAAGACGCLLLFLFWLAWNHAVVAFVDQNIAFPYQERLHFAATLVETYSVSRSFERYNGWLHYDCWRLLVVAGTAICVVACLRPDDRRPLRHLILIPTLAFALGTFQSQGYFSTYGIYEVAAILLFELYAWLRPYGNRIAAVAMVAIAAAFLYTGAVDLSEGTRLWFLRRPFDDPTPFQLAKLRGLSGTREYVHSFEKLAATVQEVIPEGERFFYYPGDLPLYYVTGRRFPLPNFLVQTSAGWDSDQAKVDIERERVPWLIVRTVSDHSSRVPQVANDEMLMDWVHTHYDVVKWLDHFVICKLKERPKRHQRD